jgi:uncharacterized protein YkwD
VRSADADGVTLAVGDQERRLAWWDVPEPDLLPLLTPEKPTADQRLGVALLAAGLGDRDRFTAILLPLFERGEAVAAASELVARHLYGRARPPEGGYRVYKGEILDPTGYERRIRAEQVVLLRAAAESALEKVSKDAAFKKLDKLRALRAQLDERRKSALLAIFDEKHYPYPYDKASLAYRTVQKEIDDRVALVREIWEDPLSVKVSRKGPLEKAFEQWDEALAGLKRLEEDVLPLEARMAEYAAFATGEAFTIQEFFLNDAERRLLEYNRWVMETFNPQQRAEATDAEARQTQVTNEYRVMMGFAAAVEPGPAPYEAIDETTVKKILDEGRVQSLVPLRAVRIDDRLVRSARGHSLDMQKRGFFNHFAPPNPATGAPQTSPFDRMQAAGYKGGGASENIAAGAPSPEVAHDRWCHSSGHHRNILSPWTDQGVGQAGSLWTQNFGSGGGRPPVIEPPGSGDAEDPGKPGRRSR